LKNVIRAKQVSAVRHGFRTNPKLPCIRGMRRHENL